jgi:LysM repeat protein
VSRARTAVVAASVALAATACSGNARVPEERSVTPDSPPTVLSVATTTVPMPTEVPYYTVVQGDTVGKIAVKLGVDAQAVIDANGIANANRIQIGQQLRIPAGGKRADGTIVGIAPPTTTTSAAAATTRKP